MKILVKFICIIVLLQSEIKYCFVNGRDCSPPDTDHGAVVTGSEFETWPKGKVYYKIESSYTSEQIRIIKDGMNMIESQTRNEDETNCISFIPQTNQKNYLDIKNEGTCWSHVGKFVEPKSQSMYLKSDRCLEADIVAHELIHALGFQHEELRPDRDNWIKINYENVLKSRNHYFLNTIKNYLNLSTPYDYKSIMHSSDRLNSRDKNKGPTMTSLNSESPIAPGKVLSEIDVQEIRSLYECKSEFRNIPDCVLYTDDNDGQKYNLKHEEKTNNSIALKAVTLKKDCRVKMCKNDNEQQCEHQSSNKTFSHPRTFSNVACECDWTKNQINLQEQCSQISREGRLTIRFIIKPLGSETKSIEVKAGFFTFIINDTSISIKPSSFNQAMAVNKTVKSFWKLLHFNASESSIWISIFSLRRDKLSENFFKFGYGYIYEANTIFTFKPMNQETVELMRTIKNIDMDSRVHVRKMICSTDVVVKDRYPLIFEHPDWKHLSLNVMTPSDLPAEGRRLYQIARSQNLKLTDEEANAINYSIESEGCSLNVTLKAKAKKSFGASDSRTAYVRVTFDYIDGGAPGQPYVFEIWPKGHFSPIHNHGDTVAVIKMLHGSLKSEWYNPLSDEVNEELKPAMVGNIVKGDITWMTPCYYQTHKLINENSTTAAMSIQSYAHVETVSNHSESFNYILPNEGKLKRFYPNSDYTFDELIEIVLREYRTKTCDNADDNVCKCSFSGHKCGRTISKPANCKMNFRDNTIYSCDQSGKFSIFKSCSSECLQSKLEKADCQENRVIAKVQSPNQIEPRGTLIFQELGQEQKILITGNIEGLGVNTEYDLVIHYQGEFVEDENCSSVGEIFTYDGIKLNISPPGYISRIVTDDQGKFHVNITKNDIYISPRDSFSILNRVVVIHERKSFIACGRINNVEFTTHVPKPRTTTPYRSSTSTRKSKTKWSENNKDHHFEKRGDDWVEIENGKELFYYAVVKSRKDYVILHSVDRNFYVCLKSDSALWGMINQDCTRNLYEEKFLGKWANN